MDENEHLNLGRGGGFGTICNRKNSKVTILWVADFPLVPLTAKPGSFQLGDANFHCISYQTT